MGARLGGYAAHLYQRMPHTKKKEMYMKLWLLKLRKDLGLNDPWRPIYDMATRLVQDYLGHKNIAHTVRYTRMAAIRFEGLWR